MAFSAHLEWIVAQPFVTSAFTAEPPQTMSDMLVVPTKDGDPVLSQH